MPRGRPIKTEVRDRLATILSHINFGYGYELYKIYRTFFQPTSLRNIYYNLKKGLMLGEFIIIDIKREVGTYTWGSEVQHIYYGVGPYARLAQASDKIKNTLDTLPKKEIKIDLPSWV